MTVAILRRILGAIPTLVLVSILVFAVVRLMPGDPAAALAGADATPHTIAIVRARLGLNQPIPVQYWQWLQGVFRGNLGQSLTTPQSVMDEIAPCVIVTVELIVWSMLLATVIGVPLGIVAAYRRDRSADRLIGGLTSLMIGVPTYWVGMMFILLFAVRWHIFPAGGNDTPSSMVLPAIALALPEIGMLARLVRGSFLEILSKDYIRFGRQKGLSEFRIMWRHALPNGGITILSFIGVQLGHLMAGAVVVEVVFGLPGIGRLAVDSLLARDLPTVQGTILVFAIAVVLVNLAVDLLFVVIDPRIKERRVR